MKPSSFKTRIGFKVVIILIILLLQPFFTSISLESNNSYSISIHTTKHESNNNSLQKYSYWIPYFENLGFSNAFQLVSSSIDFYNYLNNYEFYFTSGLYKASYNTIFTNFSNFPSNTISEILNYITLYSYNGITFANITDSHNNAFPISDLLYTLNMSRNLFTVPSILTQINMTINVLLNDVFINFENNTKIYGFFQYNNKSNVLSNSGLVDLVWWIKEVLCLLL